MPPRCHLCSALLPQLASHFYCDVAAWQTLITSAAFWMVCVGGGTGKKTLGAQGRVAVQYPSMLLKRPGQQPPARRMLPLIVLPLISLLKHGSKRGHISAWHPRRARQAPAAAGGRHRHAKNRAYLLPDTPSTINAPPDAWPLAPSCRRPRQHQRVHPAYCHATLRHRLALRDAAAAVSHPHATKNSKFLHCLPDSASAVQRTGTN